MENGQRKKSSKNKGQYYASDFILIKKFKLVLNFNLDYTTVLL